MDITDEETINMQNKSLLKAISKPQKSSAKFVHTQESKSTRSEGAKVPL